MNTSIVFAVLLTAGFFLLPITLVTGHAISALLAVMALCLLGAISHEID